MNAKNYNITKKACYFAYLSMSTVFSLPPLLFITFREMYNISYTLLGSLVLVNFCTQLMIDLVFTFFSRHFNIHLTVKLMPLLTSAGLIFYAAFPMLFPEHAYIGLLIGTVIFSVAAGLCEVLISPLVAAIPSETPDRDMSMVHSLYAWGVFGVVLITTFFINVFGAENWMYLTMFFATLPLVASFLFCISPMPKMNISSAETKAVLKKSGIGIIICVLCIFLGGAAENVMTNWISGYMENTLLIPKKYGDIIGMAVFAFLLGFARVLYAKYGRNILKTLIFSMFGSVICYLVAGISNFTIVSLIACIFTGFCTAMLWPGTLILMEEKMPNLGVTAYALMAAGGDLGSSVAPQVMGIIFDTVSVSDFAKNLSVTFQMTTEQIAMRTGMIIAAIFPLLGLLLLLAAKKYFLKKTMF